MKKDIDEILLTSTSIDEIIKSKMEEEIKNAQIEKNKKLSDKIITDIKLVPQNLIFAKCSIFKVFNRENRTISFVNGIQAEAMIGMQKSLYEKVKQGLIKTFTTEKEYIQFEKTKIKKEEI